MVVNLTPRPLYCQKMTRYSLYGGAGWAPGPGLSSDKIRTVISGGSFLLTYVAASYCRRKETLTLTTLL